MKNEINNQLLYLPKSKLFYKSSFYNNLELYIDRVTIIDLNAEPDAFVIEENLYRIYKYKTKCRFEYIFGPIGTRTTFVTIKIGNKKFGGFTTPENWKSKKCMIDKIMSDDECECTIWFSIATGDNNVYQMNLIQFVKIGDI